MTRLGFGAGILAMAISAHGPARAAPPKLPIAEGVWVKTDTQCKSAFIGYVYNGARFGSVYLYGPDQSMGPANETEGLTKIGRGKNDFTVINEGPIEVASKPKGEAAVRAVSLSEGVQWTEVVKLCPAATLSPKFRSGLIRVRLIPAIR